MLRLLVTRKWLIRHVLLLMAVAVFLALGWWQVQRAGAGNARSIGYAFEWPLLALCAIYAWVRALRSERHPPAEPAEPAESPEPTAWAAERLSATPSRRPTAIVTAEEPDEEMDAYNRYLAGLHEQDQQQRR